MTPRLRDRSQGVIATRRESQLARLPLSAHPAVSQGMRTHRKSRDATPTVPLDHDAGERGDGAQGEDRQEFRHVRFDHKRLPGGELKPTCAAPLASAVGVDRYCSSKLLRIRRARCSRRLTEGRWGVSLYSVTKRVRGAREGGGSTSSGGDLPCSLRGASAASDEAIPVQRAESSARSRGLRSDAPGLFGLRPHQLALRARLPRPLRGLAMTGPTRR